MGCVELCAKCGGRPRAVRSKDPLRYRPDCRDCINAARRGVCRPKARHRRDARTVDEERVPRLASGPIRAWLNANKGDMDSRRLGLMCQLDYAGVGRILNGTYATVSLDTVDKVLVAFDAAIELGRLYPELYDDPSVFA